MKSRTFGNSGLASSPIGFGTWALSTTQYGKVDLAEASKAIRSALDQGITLFDTAEDYGPFVAEETLGNALEGRRDEATIVTKVGWDYNEAGKNVGRNSNRDYLINRAEGCLKRLKTDCIDLLLIHYRDHDTPIEEPMAAMEQLEADGKIRHHGVSNYNVEMMRACEPHGRIIANQVGYHMFDRRMEKEVLPYCETQAIGFMAYGALAFGLLAGAFSPDTEFADNDWRRNGSTFGLPLFEREHFLKELKVVEKLKAFASDHGRTVAQLAMAWVLSHPAVTVALVGVRNDEELQSNMSAASWELTDSDKSEIDRIFREEDVSTYIDAPQRI